MIPVQNLHNPVEINFSIGQLSSLPFSSMDLSSKAAGVPFYVEVMLNETGVTTYILLQPESEEAVINYFLGVDRVPTNETNDQAGELSLANNRWRDSSVIIYEVDAAALVRQSERNNTSADTLYVGFVPKFGMYNIFFLLN